MEMDKQQSEEKQQSQFHQDEVGDDELDFSKFSSDNGNNVDEELHKIHDKLDKQSAEFRAEIEAVKVDNKLSHERNNALLAKIGELHARNDELLSKLETMEQKLKVAELETKLAKQEVHNLIAEKISEMADQMEEKLKLATREQEAKMADRDKKLEYVEKLAQEIDQGMADFGGKMADLENQVQQKFGGQLVEGIMDLNADEVFVNGNQWAQQAWNNNRWDISSKYVQLDAEGLSASRLYAKSTVTVRAQQHVSRELLASISDDLRLVYFEVLLKNFPPSSTGWLEPLTSIARYKSVGECPGSYAINEDGEYWNSGNKSCRSYANKFQNGDVIGSGMLLARDGRFKLFFTQNGQLLGEPMVTERRELFPAISLRKMYTAIEANFGVDPVGKPFMFDINANEAQLFD